MAFDPMQGFEIGQKIGASKKSSLNRTSDYMSDLTKERDKERSKINPLELFMAKQALTVTPDTGVYSWNPTSGKLEKEATVPKGSVVRNTTTEEDITNKLQAGKGVTGAGAESGRIALARESVKNIQDVKNILFPDGTPDSFKRSIAAESNIFGGFGEEAQKVFRKTSSSMAARQLIQTGVAARPEEVQNLERQFKANIKSNPAAAMQALDELQEFYKLYLGTADPSAMFSSDAQGAAVTGEQPSEDPKERLKKKLLQRGLL